MSAPVSGRKTPVDHGVQIRFINNLHDTGGGVSGPSRKEAPKKPSSRYGVAVRVQGIGGQPYVVLKEGEKGDSYGVQLRTQPPAYNSLPRYCLHFLILLELIVRYFYSLSQFFFMYVRRKEDGVIQGPYFSSGENANLRRTHSHGDLLDSSDDFTDQIRRPLGDGRSGSYGNLDGGGVGVGADRSRERMERNQWGGSYQAGLNGTFGRGRGSQYTSSESVEISHYNERAPSSNHQTPVNRFIERVEGGSSVQADHSGGPARGRYPGHNAEDRPASASPSHSPLVQNSYPSPPSSSPGSAYSSLGRGSGSVAKVKAVTSSSSQWTTSVDSHVSN